MQRLYKFLVMVAVPVLAMADGGDCDAQIVSSDGCFWVAGRHRDDEFPKSDGVKAVAIHVEPPLPNTKIHTARLFAYMDVDDDGFYEDMVELTAGNQLLIGSLEEDKNSHRPTLVLQHPTKAIKVFLTKFPVRKSGSVVVCRIKFKNTGPSDSPCDEVPTDDILVEEELGENAEGEPASDPEYEEPPPM